MAETLEKAIYNVIKDSYKEASADELKERADLIIKKLDELDKFFSQRTYSNTASQLSIYSSLKGWDDILRRVNSKKDYAQIYKIISEILDLLRGQPIQLDVYKVERSDSGKVIGMTHYFKKESEATLLMKENRYGKFVTEEVQYLLKDLEEEELTNERFLRHYSNFEKLANSHFKKGKNFNEGHVIEAFQRHLVALQHDDKFSDRLSAKHVAIMLYYSTKNAPWWTGGDVGYSQIKKYNNQRLASQKSIRMVANKLLSMMNNPAIFEESFKTMFTQDEINEIANTEHLEQYTLNELLGDQLKRFNVKI